MANCMFEVTVSNSVRNQVQNVTGKYGTGTGTGFTAQACPAGRLVVQNGLLPLEGYEDYKLLNGNAWYFNDAASGIVVGATGDHTGIFACNTYNVNRVSDGENAWNLGARTLGLTVPADERTDFTELYVGEQYTFGVDNFTAKPDDITTNKYATIANGQWTATNTAPTDGGVYAQIMRTKPVNEGTSFWGDGYVLKILRSAKA